MFNKESYMWKLDVSKNLLQKKTYGQIATVKVRWQVNENGGSRYFRINQRNYKYDGSM